MIFYHGTSEENWQKIQDEGILWGIEVFRGFNKILYTDTINRHTFLTPFINEARHYGNIILEVQYEPKGKYPTDNYHGTEAFQVFEPILIENIKRIE